MQTKTTLDLIARIMNARTTGHLSDNEALFFIQDLLAGNTADTMTAIRRGWLGNAKHTAA
jgi:hypothetical protein